MLPAEHSDGSVAAANSFTSADVVAVLREHEWLSADPTAEQISWCERAAAILGGHVADGAALRELALLVLDGGAVNSERFSEIITRLKATMELRGRELFHPIRLALAGRAGEGELDRVILLLDDAAALSFAVTVKSARERIVEFCSALD